MKILYVITKSNWGGAQRHVYDLALAMRNKGHDVWVALGGEGALKKNLEASGIYTFSIAHMKRDISVGHDAGSLREIYNVIKDKRPDVVHLHSPKAAGLGSVAARLLRVKNIIVTVHGWTFNEDRPLMQKIGIRFFSWLTMILSHKTVVLSQKEFDQGVRFPFVKEKLHLIPLGLKSTPFISVEGAKQEISKMIGIQTGDFSKKVVIGTIAELHKNKSLNELIDAMALVAEQHTNALCVIVGEGEERENLTNQIREKSLRKYVYLPGFLPQASEYLKAFNIFVLPSLKEGLPYTILEAGAASLPVVATSVGGIPEIIDDMKSGILIKPKNHRELAHAISFMIEHPEERRKYGASLKEKVATKFAFDKMVWLTESIYASSLATPQSV